MSKNHSGRPLNVNHHTKKIPQTNRVASRMEGLPRSAQRKAGAGK